MQARPDLVQMKRKIISQKLWKPLLSLLVPPARSVQGGLPRVDDFAALNGILFVLTTGIPWEDLPKELGFGSGMTCWRRLRDWQAQGEPPKDHPAYYLRYCKTFSRMGGTMRYVSAHNRDFLLALARALEAAA